MALAVLGMNMKLYYSTTPITVAGTPPSSPQLAGNVKDVTCSLSADAADTTTRSNNGWKSSVATLRTLSITFTMLWKPDDSFFDAIQEAFVGGTELAIMALDGLEATVGSQGPLTNVTITSFDRAEPLADVSTVNVTLSASSFTSWYTKAGT